MATVADRTTCTDAPTPYTSTLKELRKVLMSLLQNNVPLTAGEDSTATNPLQWNTLSHLNYSGRKYGIVLCTCIWCHLSRWKQVPVHIQITYCNGMIEQHIHDQMQFHNSYFGKYHILLVLVWFHTFLRLITAKLFHKYNYKHVASIVDKNPIVSFTSALRTYRQIKQSLQLHILLITMVS